MDNQGDGDVNNVATCTGYIRCYLSFLDELQKRKIPKKERVVMVQNFMNNFLAYTAHCQPVQEDAPQIFFMNSQDGEA